MWLSSNNNVFIFLRVMLVIMDIKALMVHLARMAKTVKMDPVDSLVDEDPMVFLEYLVILDHLELM